MANEAYQPDLGETGSQRPLYEKYLPEDKLVKNPANWYENSITKEIHQPNRKANDIQVELNCLLVPLTLEHRIKVPFRIRFGPMQWVKQVHYLRV